MSNVNKISNLPNDTSFYVILKDDSIHIPGDERSRTNPGHGYPATNMPIVNMDFYPSEAAFVAAINLLANTHKTYKAFKMSPIEVNVATTITIKE